MNQTKLKKNKRLSITEMGVGVKVVIGAGLVGADNVLGRVGHGLVKLLSNGVGVVGIGVAVVEPDPGDSVIQAAAAAALAVAGRGGAIVNLLLPALLRPPHPVLGLSSRQLEGGETRERLGL